MSITDIKMILEEYGWEENEEVDGQYKKGWYDGTLDVGTLVSYSNRTLLPLADGTNRYEDLDVTCDLANVSFKNGYLVMNLTFGEVRVEL